MSDIFYGYAYNLYRAPINGGSVVPLYIRIGVHYSLILINMPSLNFVSGLL